MMVDYVNNLHALNIFELFWSLLYVYNMDRFITFIKLL